MPKFDVTSKNETPTRKRALIDVTPNVWQLGSVRGFHSEEFVQALRKCLPRLKLPLLCWRLNLIFGELDVGSAVFQRANGAKWRRIKRAWLGLEVITALIEDKHEDNCDAVLGFWAERRDSWLEEMSFGLHSSYTSLGDITLQSKFLRVRSSLKFTRKISLDDKWSFVTNFCKKLPTLTQVFSQSFPTLPPEVDKSS